MSIQGHNLSNNPVTTEYFGASRTDDDDLLIITELPQFSTVTSGIANVTSPVIRQSSGQASILENLIIPLYGTIFFLSIVGNSLVLITLARNKRMRTVTNVYLLNLAISDLLLGVFCMPFTLLGQILKNFVFGLTMCKLIPYFQAVSVSVGVWTLVAISLERYFAICRPLKSRRWQTQFHAYKMIAVVWTLSLTWNMPILVVSRLKSLRGGRRKCREEWPSVGSERAYNLFLDGTLLLVPLLLMSLAYSLIAIKLWRGLKLEIRQSSTRTKRHLSQGPRIQIRANGSGCLTRETKDNSNEDQQNSICPLSRQHVIRSNYMGKSIEAKKKVIRMLFVIVLEFFVCWAPLHVINTWYLFAPDLVYSVVGSTGISLVQLLAYVSSCCNPITYCFMNKKFRQAFLGLFDCHRCWRVSCRHNDVAMATTANAGQTGNNSELSGNDSAMYLGRASLVARSGIIILLN
ncbi:Cholecystokinin receptor [Ooceraea biroi]|uniref:Gastrin/cholecystokinin type B receptor n=1 Tax=Ooceraea biroi TaxID=2015173 RepID=A0A026WK40_OOCBI|nr:Cholecystokinin receptor [Ooceraea biroi]